MKFLPASAGLLALVVAAACDKPESAANAAPAAETQADMPQDHTSMQGNDLQARLIAHVGQVNAAGPAEFRQRFPQHRDLVNEMLGNCRDMMRNMNMTPPRQFTEMETALEADLARIPSLSDQELQSLLPQHIKRVQGVIDMRQDMMDKMM